MKVFVSHISEEKELAFVLKKWIEETTSGQCEVFVSSDSTDIPAGDKWLEKINNSLTESNLLILLFSKESMARPWINFEAGCAWIKNIPVIPIIHSGIELKEVNPPISEFQCLKLESDEFFDKLFKAIYKYADLHKMPRINGKDFEKELRVAAESIQKKIKTSHPENPTFKPEELQTKILKNLLSANDSKRVGLDEIELSKSLKISLSVLKHNLEQLISRKLVLKGMIMYEGSYIPNMHYYSISKSGIKLMIDEQSN